MANPPIQKLGAIGLSLLGVWTILQAVSQLAFYLPIILAGDLAWEQLFGPLVHALLGAALVSQRTSLSKALFRKNVEVELDALPPVAELLVALLGVWLTVTSVARAAQVELSLLNEFSLLSELSHTGDMLSFMLAADAWSQRAPYLVTLAFGVFLILRAPGLARVWLSVRAAGRER